MRRGRSIFQSTKERKKYICVCNVLENQIREKRIRLLFSWLFSMRVGKRYVKLETRRAGYESRSHTSKIVHRKEEKWSIDVWFAWRYEVYLQLLYKLEKGREDEEGERERNVILSHRREKDCHSSTLRLIVVILADFFQILIFTMSIFMA